MQEDFLQYIWQYQLFSEEFSHKLTLSNGDIVQVIHTGMLNRDQGPDFLNATVVMDGVTWNGSIEVHLKSSDWYKHKHQGDFNYKNVVLHVVWENDKQVMHEDGTPIPTLELHHGVDAKAYSFYEYMLQTKEKLVCGKQLKNVPSLHTNSMLERVLVERLERKSVLYEKWWLANNKDWAQTTFEVVAYCLGLKINAETMRELAHSIPYKILWSLVDQPSKVESVLYGMGGFLESSEGHYLLKEYAYLKHKHVLFPEVTKEHWKYSRLRPAAFPEVRIGQLTALVLHKQSLFSRIKEATDIATLKSIFSNTFDSKFTDKESTPTGNKTLEVMIINAVLPLWFLVYKKEDNPEFLNRIFAVLEQLDVEQNHKTTSLSAYFEMTSAYSSQAVMELYDYYCTPKRCLECGIAKAILS